MISKPEELNIALKSMRKANGFSQDEVAKRCKCDKRTIRRYETGKDIPSIRRLCQLCNIYGCDLTIEIKPDIAILIDML